MKRSERVMEVAQGRDEFSEQCEKRQEIEESVVRTKENSKLQVQQRRMTDGQVWSECLEYQEEVYQMI